MIKHSLVESLDGPRARSMDEDDDETYQRETTANSSKHELYESAS